MNQAIVRYGVLADRLPLPCQPGYRSTIVPAGIGRHYFALVSDPSWRLLSVSQPPGSTFASTILDTVGSFLRPYQFLLSTTFPIAFDVANYASVRLLAKLRGDDAH